MNEEPTVLDRLVIAAPCSASWNSMEGDDRIRHCNSCSKHVYNISSMTRQEAEQFLSQQSTGKCMRFFRRKDGTVLTDDCPVGLRKIRERCRTAINWIAGMATLLMSWSGGALAQYAGSSDSSPESKASPPPCQPLMGDVYIPPHPALKPLSVKQSEAGSSTSTVPASSLSGDSKGSVKLRAEVNADSRALRFYRLAQESADQGKFLVAQTYYQQAISALGSNADPKFRELLQTDLRLLQEKLGGVNRTKTESRGISLPSTTEETTLVNCLVRLKSAYCFDGQYTGYAGSKSENYLAYEDCGAKGAKIRVQLERLVHSGSPAGRLYAAMLLRRIDKKSGDTALRAMAKDQTAVDYNFVGCSPMQGTVAFVASRLLKKSSDPLSW